MRLTIDLSLVGDSIICSELERTITAMLDIPNEKADIMVSNHFPFISERIIN